MSEVSLESLQFSHPHPGDSTEADEDEDGYQPQRTCYVRGIP
jgi:hypothetical protein